MKTLILPVLFIFLSATVFSQTDQEFYSGNTQPTFNFQKDYEQINKRGVLYSKFQKYPMPASKQSIVQWLDQFEISSESNIVYNYDVDPEDWKGVTAYGLICYKNGIIVQKLMGYEGTSIKMEFPFLSVTDAKLLFKKFNLLDMASGCFDELEIEYKYDPNISGTTVYFANGC